MPGDVPPGSDDALLGLLSEFFAEQMIGRAMGITERCGTLPMVQSVPEHVTDGGKDMIVAIQPQQEVKMETDFGKSKGL